MSNMPAKNMRYCKARFRSLYNGILNCFNKVVWSKITLEIVRSVLIGVLIYDLNIFFKVFLKLNTYLFWVKAVINTHNLQNSPATLKNDCIPIVFCNCLKKRRIFFVNVVNNRIKNL